MTSSFETHGITHLSPSSLNAFAAAPAVFVMERLLKRTAPVGCAAHRGTASEHGIQLGLMDMDASVEDCQTQALLKFDGLAALSGDPKREKEREAVPGIVATGLATFRKGGAPTGYQGKVVHEFEGIPVPILGFYDWEWAQHGFILDLKSSLKISNEIKTAHARQVSLYVHKTNFAARVGYVTPSKVNVLTLANPQDHLADLLNIARRLGRFLAVSNDPQELAGILCPDFESYFLSNSIAQANAREVFGFHQPSAPPPEVAA